MTVDRLADSWEAAWSGREPGRFRSICATDLHYEDPLTRPPIRGIDAIAAHAARAWTAFPDLQLERSGPRLLDGQVAALPVRIRGTHVGELDGLPATGKFVSTHAVFWCELDPDRRLLWRIRAFFDVHDVAVTLGLLPKPGSVRNRALMVLQGYGLRIGR